MSGVQAHRVFQIELGPGVTISGLTIRDGSEPQASGGGIRVELGGRLTLIGTVVMGNTADNGAGISSLGALTLVGSTIAANNATEDIYQHRFHVFVSQQNFKGRLNAFL